MFSTDSIRKKDVLQVQSERFFLKIFFVVIESEKENEHGHFTVISDVCQQYSLQMSNDDVFFLV